MNAFKRSTIYSTMAAAVLLAGLIWLIASGSNAPQVERIAATASTVIKDSELDDLIVDRDLSNQSAGKPLPAALPAEEQFVLAGQSGSLQLWAEPLTAHFKVVDTGSGAVWRSYPDPRHWQAESSTGLWYSNLLSPVMLEYIDATNSKSQSVLTNLIEEGGSVQQLQWIEQGFRGMFQFVKSGFSIPFEVKLGDGFVEAKIIDDGIVEDKFSLLNLKLYSQFGAQPSIDPNGYILIPDGSGALISFDGSNKNEKAIYQEMVYGADIAFYNETTNRQPVIMPIYGLKSGKQSFVAVLTEGEQYAKIFAASANALGQSNWVTGEWQYRLKFFQKTDREGKQGFFTYSTERFQADARTTRYYVLAGDNIDYDEMAARYRGYLIERYQLSRLETNNEAIPFYLDLIGADVQEGLLWDDYIVGTTAGQASELVAAFQERGIPYIHAIYYGWQRWGYSSYGGLFPIDKRIGGNQGMKSFIAQTRQQGGKVYLAANYALNSSNRGGFWSLRDGLRNLAGTLLKQETDYSDGIPYVSPRYAIKQVEQDLASYASLGVDGALFSGGIASFPYTDFNSNYRASRAEVVSAQQQVMQRTREQLGLVAADSGAFYSLAAASHFHHLPDDYSYDIFVDEQVPFAQIALHGLATYTSASGNLRQDYHKEFLRSIEYGAYPTYLLAAAEASAFKKSYSIWQYSIHAQDWLESAAKEYEAMNAALHDVQDQFIVEHGTLAAGVKRTIYENGKQIIVNYNDTDYIYQNKTIAAQSFIALEEEGVQ